jgi:hypothetical protein
MAKDKEKKEVEEVVEVKEAPESEARLAFKALIKAYNERFPHKAEAKKAELEKKLAAIK